MLPTTGYFKSINCPFFDSCICERPYCHYKHTKREPVSDSNLISELVSKAVHKVLNVNLHVPTSTDTKAEPTDEAAAAGPSTSKVTYNPTPISELNKYKNNSNGNDKVEKKSSRHIPIQYTPERPVRSLNVNYTTTSEYVTDTNITNTKIGYSPTPRTFSSVSYIPSSIRSLCSKSNDSSQECKGQPYVPSNSHTVNSQTDPLSAALNVKYSPTRNLDITKQSKDEYVPNYKSDYNGYFPNTNLYEIKNVSEPKTGITADINVDNLKISNEYPNEQETNKNTSFDKKKSDKERKSSSKQSHKERKDSSHSNGYSDKHRSSSDKHRHKSSEKHSSGNDTHKSSKDKEKHSNKHKTVTEKHKISNSKNKADSDKHSSSEKHKHSSEKHKHSSEKHKHSSDKNKHNNDKHKYSNDKHKTNSEKHKTSSDKQEKKVKHKSSSDSKRTHSKTTSEQKLSSRTHSSNSSGKCDKYTSSSDNKDKSKDKNNDASSESDMYFEKVDFLTAEDLADSDSDSTTMEECKRIFEEYIPHFKPEPVQEPIEEKNCTEEDSSKVCTGKKRVAHEKSANLTREAVSKPKPHLNAALIMSNRYNAVRLKSDNNNSTVQLTTSTVNMPQKRTETQVHAVHAAAPVSLGLSISQTTSSTDNSFAHYQPPAKIRRIAHVPNVSSLLNAKKKVEELAKMQDYNKTPVQTISKGAKRVAHVPEIPMADFPQVIESDKSRLPVNVRARYLSLMIKETRGLYISTEAAYERALNEEHICYQKCCTLGTYKNSAMLTVNRLRKERDTGLTSYSTDASSVSRLNDSSFYENISKWILTEEELLENGFPRPSTESGRALFKVTCPNANDSLPPLIKVCARCNLQYRVDENNYQLNEQECIYHPGRRYYYRGDNIYSCCRGNVSADGCAVAPAHVFKINNPADLTGFVRTFPPTNSSDSRSTAVYALDCEMLYTNRGIELARVTVIGTKSEVVYESLVRPLGTIIDYNTRFSGLTEAAFKNVSTSILDVQASLLALFNSKTILIGHSLENDLIAMRIIHDTVVDTSVLFPHKMGPPRKKSLRSLASEYLKKIIQDNEGGHDSAEDAVTCMELVQYKLSEHAKAY